MMRHIGKLIRKLKICPALSSIPHRPNRVAENLKNILTNIHDISIWLPFVEFDFLFDEIKRHAFDVVMSFYYDYIFTNAISYYIQRPKEIDTYTDRARENEWEHLVMVKVRHQSQHLYTVRIANKNTQTSKDEREKTQTLLTTKPSIHAQLKWKMKTKKAVYVSVNYMIFLWCIRRWPCWRCSISHI